MKHPARGQAMVELAAALPVFLILLLGLIEFSRAIYTWNAFDAAARAGARAAAAEINPGDRDAAAITAANDVLAPHNFPFKASIDIKTPKAPPTGGDPYAVTVETDQYQTTIGQVIPGLASILSKSPFAPFSLNTISANAEAYPKELGMPAVPEPSKAKKGSGPAKKGDSKPKGGKKPKPPEPAPE